MKFAMILLFISSIAFAAEIGMTDQQAKSNISTLRMKKDKTQAEIALLRKSIRHLGASWANINQ